MRVLHVRLVCGRIVGTARAVSQAYEFGASEGPHDWPWHADYYREAVRVYAESLPASYQREISELFSHAAAAMDDMLIPGRLAGDWLVVAQFLRLSSAAIEEWLAAGGPDTSFDVADLPDVEGSDEPPMVVRFDGLAVLTTRQAVLRLQRAAVAVQQHLDSAAPQNFTAAEQHLLEMVSHGVHIPEMAAELGYSQRSIYRQLSKLWQKLGVPGRKEGLERAASEGLIH